MSRTECCGNRNVDKAEAISRAAAAENCCAREKAKKRRKISIGFSIFFSLFVFVLFGVDEREQRGVNRLEGELCWNFTVVFALWLPQGMAGERGVEGEGDCACVLRRRLARIFD